MIITGDFGKLSHNGKGSLYNTLKLAVFLDRSLLSGLAKKQMLAIKHELDLTDDQISFYHTDSDLQKIMEWRVLACPAVLRMDLHPPRWLIGELRNKDVLLAFLNAD